MWDNLKDSFNSLFIGFSTFFLGAVNNLFSNLPVIHDLLGTISMGLGCIACAIVIIVNWRQARINRLIEKDLETKMNNKLARINKLIVKELGDTQNGKL